MVRLPTPCTFFLFFLACAHGWISKILLRDSIRIKKLNSAEPKVKLEWRPEGYETWIWKTEDKVDIKVNYVARGIDKPGDPLVLVHGFGASCYHWRHQLPDLGEDRPVFALDLVGFGLSDKPIIDYSPELWRDQVYLYPLNLSIDDHNKFIFLLPGVLVYR